MLSYLFDSLSFTSSLSLSSLSVVFCVFWFFCFDFLEILFSFSSEESSELEEVEEELDDELLDDEDDAPLELDDFLLFAFTSGVSEVDLRDVRWPS